MLESSNAWVCPSRTARTPLELTLGLNNKVLIPRRVVSLEIKLTGFPVYRTEAFVMTIPEQKNVLLGMPWLEEVNPEIDWKNKLIKFRGSEESTEFRQCVHELLMHYTKHTLASSSGDTRVITAYRLEKLKLSDGEFCFFVNIASERAARLTPPTRSLDIEAEVELSDISPIVRKQFRLSEEQKEVVRKWTLGWRVVHYFRAINARVKIPATPIPRKEDIYDAMAKGKLFSALDPLWGFFQVRLRERDIPPSAFNRLIQTVFEDQREFCRAYFDDLFVFTASGSMNDHLAALDKVLARCEEQQLYVKLSKCTFCAEEIPCLGDYFGRHGIRMDPDKVSAIKDWPQPRTKRELQSFLGTCVYVLKYCPNFASLTAPLTGATRGLSKNERVEMTEEQLAAFAELKLRLASPPVLAHPDSSKPFHVKTDASDYAVGGYLFHVDSQDKERVIAYGGRKLSTAERMYPTREKELLAALHAMRIWKPYLIDKPFYLDTYHRTP
ncbi:polyprotein [Phytophthora megakarya]|uniref:Polyprotein n=1 Tax=Phytophthora megakarya TaxID=4795 RepID=A0A225VEF9_9STRA|nr:polyprotein [Phytophthora megakarya]